jgi:tellurite resistance protein TerB
MMEWLKSMTEGAMSALQNEIDRHKNREFLECVVAGCALVAAADGKIDSDEKQKMMQFMNVSKELKVFSAGDVIQLFNSMVEQFDFDFGIGKIEALKVVSRLRNKPEAARTMVFVCCKIGAADGNFDDDEKRAVREICTALGLAPSEFGLA